MLLVHSHGICQQITLFSTDNWIYASEAYYQCCIETLVNKWWLKQPVHFYNVVYSCTLMTIIIIILKILFWNTKKLSGSQTKFSKIIPIILWLAVLVKYCVELCPCFSTWVVYSNQWQMTFLSKSLLNLPKNSFLMSTCQSCDVTAYLNLVGTLKIDLLF